MVSVLDSGSEGWGLNPKVLVCVLGQETLISHSSWSYPGSSGSTLT